MSTASDLHDLLRRQSVGSQAEFTVEATMASMAIRAVRANADVRPRPALIAAVQHMLQRIDQLATYKAGGHLGELVSDESVAKETLEVVQVMARAARNGDPAGDKSTVAFPVLDSLINYRSSIEVDAAAGKIAVKDSAMAAELADALAHLGSEVLTSAVNEDRSRTSNYAVR